MCLNATNSSCGVLGIDFDGYGGQNAMAALT